MKLQYIKPEITVEELNKTEVLLVSAPNRNNRESAIKRDGGYWFIDLGSLM